MKKIDTIKVRHDFEIVIRKHFPAEDYPNASDQAVSATALETIDRLSVAISLEKIERSDREPTKDIESLIGAANNLRLAAEKMKKVGWHGQKHLGEIIEQVFVDPFAQELFLYQSGDTARVYLVQHLETLQRAFMAASSKVDPEGASVETAFSDSPEAAAFKKDKHKKTAAASFARDCKKIFEQFRGARLVKQNVKFSYHGDGTRKAFVAFLQDAFSAAGVEASASEAASRLISD